MMKPKNNITYRMCEKDEDLSPSAVTYWLCDLGGNYLASLFFGSLSVKLGATKGCCEN